MLNEMQAPLLAFGVPFQYLADSLGVFDIEVRNTL